MKSRYLSLSASQFNTVFLALWVVFSIFGKVQAQADCGMVNGISYPVDRSVFQLVQDFGVPSARHQGRYHTGEDYYGGRGGSLGMPVSAVADGRVTYSAPTGWGRDGGVVILQHTFPDGSVAYSMYGHMMSTDVYPFPERFACVKAGDIVGAVGNVRPAPHLHFEIRISNGDTPGAGYSPEVPTTLGSLQATKFITDWQAWFNPSHRWHLQLPDDTRPTAPPLLLNDGSMLVLTSDRVRYASSDGRVLWRIILPAPAAALTTYNGSPVLIYRDGAMQIINMDATLGESWLTGVPLDSPPLNMGDSLLFHTPDNRLAAIGADRRSVLWQLENVLPFTQSAVTPNLIGLVTNDGFLTTISTQGALVSKTPLLDDGLVSAAPDGNLWLYSQNSITQIGADGTVTPIVDNVVGDAVTSALAGSPDGTRYILAGGDVPTLMATDAAGTVLWQFAVDGASGRAQLIPRDGQLLLLTSGGDIVTVQAASGAVCSRLTIYGDRRSKLWSDLGADGMLRVGLADQIIGLDWKTLQGGCV